MLGHDRGGITESDLDFVVEAASPGVQDSELLKRLVREDRAFKEAMIGDDRVFQRVMNDEEVFLKISPPLYFEVLLRRAHKELQVATHTVERAGRQSLPVFDTGDVLDFLSRPEAIGYLAQMLASFIRIESYVMRVRVGRGIRRRVRYNDMDVDSLVRFCAAADEEHRFGYYRRIADVCLFVSGVFPNHTYIGFGRPSGERSPATLRRMRRSLEDYEVEGRRFYGLAEKHPTARVMNLTGVFGLLRERFAEARKPLTFIASQYLHSHKHQLFGVESA